VSSDREGDSLEMSLGEGGLRALLTQAAAERQLTLEYFRRNPSECSLEKRASRRLNRNDGELPKNNSVELFSVAQAPAHQNNSVELFSVAQAPAHQSTRAEAPGELPSKKPASMSTSPALQQQSNREAASTTVRAEKPANASVPNASASEQSQDVDETYAKVAEESPSKDTKSQCRQLLETRAELRFFQGVLKAERDAVAEFTARLQDYQRECDKLQDKVKELHAAKQAAESQKVQKMDIEEISDELLEELEQEIDDLREKLEASESKNTTQQAEWESIKQELTAEIQELKSKLAGAEAETARFQSVTVVSGSTRPAPSSLACLSLLPLAFLSLVSLGSGRRSTLALLLLLCSLAFPPLSCLTRLFLLRDCSLSLTSHPSFSYSLVSFSY
jgi:hypothetical protein